MDEKYLDQRVHEYLDGELSPVQRASFENDLKTDAALTEKLRTIRKVRTLLAQLPRECVPENVTASILSAVEASHHSQENRLKFERMASKTGFFSRLSWRKISAVTGILCLAAVTAMLFPPLKNPFSQREIGMKLNRNADTVTKSEKMAPEKSTDSSQVSFTESPKLLTEAEMPEILSESSPEPPSVVFAPADEEAGNVAKDLRNALGEKMKERSESQDFLKKETEKKSVPGVTVFSEPITPPSSDISDSPAEDAPESRLQFSMRNVLAVPAGDTSEEKTKRFSPEMFSADKKSDSMETPRKSGIYENKTEISKYVGRDENAAEPLRKASARMDDSRLEEDSEAETAFVSAENSTKIDLAETKPESSMAAKAKAEPRSGQAAKMAKPSDFSGEIPFFRELSDSSEEKAADDFSAENLENTLAAEAKMVPAAGVRARHSGVMENSVDSVTVELVWMPREESAWAKIEKDEINALEIPGISEKPSLRGISVAERPRDMMRIPAQNVVPATKSPRIPKTIRLFILPTEGISLKTLQVEMAGDFAETKSDSDQRPMTVKNTLEILEKWKLDGKIIEYHLSEVFSDAADIRISAFTTAQPLTEKPAANVIMPVENTAEDESPR